MSARAEHSELAKRVLSAAVLGPVVLVALYLGSPFLELVVTAAAVAMAWEWDRLCGARRFGLSGWAAVLSLAVAGMAAWSRSYDVAGLALVLGTLAVYAAAAAANRSHLAWISAAPIVIGVPCAALLWLRALPMDGFETALWLIGAIWATDIAAFAIGRLVGGTRLAPRISPRKTWAGLFGGVAMAALWGLLFAVWAGAKTPWLLCVLGACAALVAQAGDLGVSSVKRRFGAKDSSNLIPGHGGVLDRLDGMLTAAPALVALILVSNAGILAW
ncbi:MAG: phosphatidate cytidylyltransferase [Defluviicoccus sp.]|nr:phosphatidate cytidylyltransferase [Defluviicoccus sp.]MDE0386957.1 phosphatidate cytidylyltransferase [Defluviicoccus sp.]